MITVAGGPATTLLPRSAGCSPGTPLPSGMWQVAHAIAYSFAPGLSAAGVAGAAGAAAGRGAAWAVPAVASATILVLTAINLLGARPGSAVQTFFTVVKVAALLVLMAFSFTAAAGSFAHLRPSAEGARNLGLGAASVIWAYDGWIAVSMIAGEVRAPERLMRRIIIAGMLAIVFLYVGANVGYFYALPLETMAGTAGGVPQRIMSDRLGPLGGALIAGAILCSVFGALNGNILAKPRVAYALARDGLTFSVARARASPVGDAARRHRRPRAGGGPARRAAPRLRPHHHVLHRRGVGRAAVRGGRGLRAAAAVAGRAPPLPDAGLSLDAARLHPRDGRRAGRDRGRRDRPAGAELLAAVGPAHRGRGVPGLRGLATGGDERHPCPPNSPRPKPCP